MAEAITIVCPECGKKINVASEAVGKKVRCKDCEHVFVVAAPGGKKAARPAAAPAKAPAGAKKKAPDPRAAKPRPDKPKADDEEENSNPYGVTSLDLAPRCPDCAQEMESEDAIICLHCGYNTQTRSKVESRAVEEDTGMVWTWWLLPGILCAVFALVFLTFDIWYSLKVPTFFPGGEDDAWYAFIGRPWFVIWLVWGPTVPLMVGMTAFAVKRLIFNPRPPERVKKKPKKEE